MLSRPRRREGSDPAHDDGLDREREPGFPWPGGRHRTLAIAAAAVLVAAGVAVAIVVGGGRQISRSERTQLENAEPGSSRHPARGVAVPPAVRRAADRLTLPRQVAQLFVVDMVGRFPRDPFFGELRRRGWGGVVVGPANFVNRGQLTALTGELAVVAGRAGPALPLVAANQSGGPASAFAGLPPKAQPLIGDTRRPAVAGSQALAAGRALDRLGINVNLAPVADVGSAAGPVESEVFSDNPTVVTRMVAAAVEGYRRAGIISAIGRFPGIGAASADPDTTSATVGLSLADLRRRDLRPFAAVARRVPVVIVSNAVYAAYDGVTPAVLLPEVVGGLLRRSLGFRGVVMTDDLNSTAAVLAEGVGSAAIQAVESGADLLYVSGGGPEQERAYGAVLSAVRGGRISRDRLRLSVLRVLALKRRYGLLAAATRRTAAPRAPARKRRAKPPAGKLGAAPPAGRPQPRPPVAGPPAPRRP